MKDVMNDNHTTASPENLVDWLKRVEITYRAIIRIIEVVRDYDISTTRYVTQFDGYYGMATGMLDFLFSTKMSPTDEVLEYKVELDKTLSKYLSDTGHWSHAQHAINNALMMIRFDQADFAIPASKEIEQKYLNELVVPVNNLLARYLNENTNNDDVVYELTFDAMRSDYYLNGVLIYHTKLSGADDVLQKAFEQSGPTKKYVSDKAVNTSSIRNNFNLHPSLKRIMIKATDNKKGLTLHTAITRAEIASYNIDTSEVDNWLKAQVTK